jgi:Flp pilus assembly protein TadB
MSEHKERAPRREAHMSSARDSSAWVLAWLLAFYVVAALLVVAALTGVVPIVAGVVTAAIAAGLTVLLFTLTYRDRPESKESRGTDSPRK